MLRLWSLSPIYKFVVRYFKEMAMADCGWLLLVCVVGLIAL